MMTHTMTILTCFNPLVFSRDYIAAESALRDKERTRNREERKKIAKRRKGKESWVVA